MQAFRKNSILFLLIFVSLPVFAEWRTVYNDKSVKNKFPNNTFGRYGTYYSNFIPEDESITDHYALMTELKTLYVQLQGCEWKNPAIFNGITLEQLHTKVLEPAQKLAAGETIGDGQKILVFMSLAEAADSSKAFDTDFACNGFVGNIGTLKPYKNYTFTYEESFILHYDSIILLQPNGKADADTVLDTLFPKLEAQIAETAQVDYFIIGHGNANGVRLSNPNVHDKAWFGADDFKPVDEGGNVYATSIRNMIMRSIDNGYNPRFIAIGCSTDGFQNIFNDWLDEEYREHLKVFGGPNETYGTCSIGYDHNGCLELITLVNNIGNNPKLVLEETDGRYSMTNPRTVDSFLIDSKASDGTGNMDVYDIIETDGKACYIKPSGVQMQIFKLRE